MKTTIWKFPLEITDRQIIVLPEGWEALTVMVQGGSLCLWAQVNPDATRGGYKIRVAGTGHEIDPSWTYLGSAQQGPFVWHVFAEATR